MPYALRRVGRHPARRRAGVAGRLGVLLTLLFATACAARPLDSRPAPAPAVGEIAVELFLIGDTGIPQAGGDPVFLALQRMLSERPDQSVAVFLGDNVYPRGLPPEGSRGRAHAERVLNEQLDVLRGSGAYGIFVPGNHDWNFFGRERLERVRRQGRFVEAHGTERVSFLPRDGCPGPETVDFGDALRLVLLDTQWWLETRQRPTGPDSPCAATTPQQVVDQLGAALHDAGERVVVVAAHHPLVTGGEHGGYFAPRKYLFPFWPLGRRMGLLDQDVFHPRYVYLIESLNTALSVAPPLVFAAGHEHNLQLLRGVGARYQVISGSGSFGHLTPVRTLATSYYARSVSGFVRLSVLHDGRVRFAAIAVEADGSVREDFTMWLERDG
jgi:hypothetical protein